MKILGITVLALATMLAMTEMTWADKSKSKSDTSAKATLFDLLGKKTGSAHYEAGTKKGVAFAKLEIEVSHLSTAAGTPVNFVVNGAVIGSSMVKGETGDDGTSGGDAKLKLATPKNTVPSITKGSTVSVQLGDGTVLASGTF